MTTNEALHLADEARCTAESLPYTVAGLTLGLLAENPMDVRRNRSAGVATIKRLRSQLDQLEQWYREVR